MKTDKILHLVQQKKAMRSGGALPLPKHQSRGQVAPFITSDPKEFARRQQLYKDSLDLYNRQNLYNAQFLANFPNAPVIPNNRVDFGDLVNLVRQQNKTSVEKNATELVNILKEGIQPSKTHSRHYPSDGRYKAHIKRTEGPLLKPGHYVPNSVANRRGLLDSLGVFDDDTKSAKHSYDERIDDPFTNTWIRSGSVTQKWKNPLFGDEHTDQVFGVPYRVIHHAKIKPIGNLLYHQRIPFSTGSSTAAEIFDPSSAMYDDASALNVSLPYYKKPVQEVIYNPRSNAANSPIIVTDRNDPRIGYYTEAGNQIRYRPPAPMSLMPMRGMPSADVEAVPQKVAVPPTPALRPRFMDMRGEWSDVLPTAYPYAQTPEMLEKMGYRGSKKEGGLAKAQQGSAYVESLCGPDYIESTDEFGNKVCIDPASQGQGYDYGYALRMQNKNTPSVVSSSYDDPYDGIGDFYNRISQSLESNFSGYCPECQENVRTKMTMPKLGIGDFFRNMGEGVGNLFDSQPGPRFDRGSKSKRCKGPKCYEFEDGGLAKAQNGLQYVPSGDYGRYYDPETKEYVPQVYLPDVEISASKDLPFQNNKFAPFLAARGTADYVPLETAFLPGTPVVKGLGKVGNVLLDAVNPLAGMNVGKGLKNLKQEILYRGITPVGYGAKEKAKMFLPNLLKYRSPEDKVIDIATEFERGMNTSPKLIREIKKKIQKQYKLSPEEYKSLSAEEKFDLFPQSHFNDLINQSKKRVDAWRTGLGLDQVYDTFDVVDGKYRIKDSGIEPGRFSTLWNDIRASELKDKVYMGDNPLVSLSKKHQEITSPKIETPYGSYSVRDLMRYLSKEKEQLKPWEQTRIVEPARNKEFQWSVYDADPKGVMGQMRWDVSETPEGMLHWQANDTWDLHPWRRRGSINVNEDELAELTRDLHRRKFLENVEVLDLLGGKPFDIQNNYIVDPKTMQIVKQWKSGGLTKSKAREILHDKSVHGHPLTDKQRKFFGAIASGKSYKVRVKKK